MPAAIKYILLIVTGFLLIWFCSLFQQVSPPQEGEYYYSSFLRNNYTLLTGIIFLFAGVLTGYFLNLKPWLAGICMILILPLVAFYEAIVYKGSHNLIPFELAIYFLLALPAVMGVYLGKFIIKLTPGTKTGVKG